MSGYTSGRTVKSNAKRPAELTIAKATSQVRTRAAKLMPGQLITVNSRTAYDLESESSVIITVVTFPEDANVLGLWQDLESLTGLESRVWGTCRFVITRSR